METAERVNETSVDVDSVLVKENYVEDENQPELSSATEILRYGIDDIPSIPMTILLAFQQYLTMFGSTIALPFVLMGPLCVSSANQLAVSKIIGTMFFVSGISTFLQSTFGVRLPIVQGGTFAFIAPTIAILSQPEFLCPSNVEEQSIEENDIDRYDRNSRLLPPIYRTLEYLPATITLVGLSLFGAATSFAEQQWGIAILTIVLIILFSQYLNKFEIFKLFPVIFAIGLSWLVCAVCTFTDVFPNDPNHRYYNSRVDAKISVITDSPWIRVPYPFQWGVPTVGAAAVMGMIAGVLASMLESIGDYYACARLSGAGSPPIHAINRGIFMEGMCCVIAAIIGTGNGTTSYSENIGAIGITKVASRRVVQASALIMVFGGCFGKFGALFSSIPQPIIGGVFFCMFGMITAVGLSNAQYTNLNLTRNLFVLGFSIFAGLAIPQYMVNLEKNGEKIDLGHNTVSNIVSVLLSTSMFVGGFIGFVLDNTIPASREDRGLTSWEKGNSASVREKKSGLVQSVEVTYDLPLINDWIHRQKLLTYLPISPSYKPKKM